MRGTLLMLALIALIVMTSMASASATDSLRSHVELSARGGYAFSSNPQLSAQLPDGVRRTHGTGALHLKYSLSGLGSPSERDVRQGVGVSLTTFFRPEGVGTPVGAYLFQQVPLRQLSPGVTVGYEWNFGLTFGWRPTHTLASLSSNVVSAARANAYINLSFPVEVSLSRQWGLRIGPEITHYSNGNTSWPNPGINTVGVTVGMIYTPSGRRRKVELPFKARLDSAERRWGVDLTLYGAWRKAYYPADAGAFTPEGEAALLRGHFGVVGLSAAAMLRARPAFRYGAALDLQWSENAGIDHYVVSGTEGADVVFRRPPFLKQTSVGLSARAEVVMPVFAVNLGLGYTVVAPHATRRFYQMANLKIRLFRPLYLNIGYRFIEFSHPSNLMLGLGVSL